MRETIKLFGGTKYLTDKTKNGEKLLILAVVEVVLIYCSLEDNQHQQKSEVLYTLQPKHLMLICWISNHII